VGQRTKDEGGTLVRTGRKKDGLFIGTRTDRKSLRDTTRMVREMDELFTGLRTDRKNGNGTIRTVNQTGFGLIGI